jgi:hypothetical protein
MKTSKVLTIVGVIVVVALAIMWFRNSSGGGDAAGPTIVTPMPLSDYSLLDTVTGSNGFPDPLPETLPPIPPPIEETDIITGAPETAMPATTSIPAMTPATTMIPGMDTLPAVQEGYMGFAPKNFRGDIL